MRVFAYKLLLWGFQFGFEKKKISANLKLQLTKVADVTSSILLRQLLIMLLNRHMVRYDALSGVFLFLITLGS